jgi:PAS domain S-box-containing protein
VGVDGRSLLGRIIRYGLAIIVSVAALLLRLWLTARVGPGLPAFITFYPAVMLAAIFWGWGPGLLATGTSALLALYAVFPPAGFFQVASAVDAAALALFVLLGGGISVAAAVYHRAQLRADRYAQELSALAAQRDAQEALRLSEEKFATAFRTSPVGITLSTVAEGRYLDVNQAFLGMVGFSRQELLGRTSVEMGVWPDTDTRERIYAELKGTGSIRHREITFHRKSGESFATLFSCELVVVAGQPVALTNMLDITARKRAEVALQQLNATLEDRVRERTADLQRLTGELAVTEQRERQRLAHVIHDGLQQLLVAANMRVRLLERHADPTVQAASREVHKLLNESVIASRSLTAELSPPILESGLIPALGWLGRWMQETHGLTVYLETGAPVVPITNPVRLLVFHAVRELLFNVKKHAHVNEARLAVRQREGWADVIVCDAGIGFDPQAVNTGTSGFGLFSIRERLQYVGGTLHIASAPGQGSRFTLTVPVQPGSPAG